MKALRAFVGVSLILALPGCTHYLNAPLGGSGPHSSYRFPAMLGQPDPADELFVCLSFSGGGTRAAAFSYGALLALHDTQISSRADVAKSLLDEVDCIAGISGGAFTAAYYGLFGAATFDNFYRDFLARDIEGELALRAANPVNLVRLLSPNFDRIDLAAELYDETVFKHQTFAALAARPRPFIMLHATSMANGGRFRFTQDDFDLLRSDLETFPVARAVAASSAFPFLLSPLTLESFPTPPGFVLPADIRNGLKDREGNWARYAWARARQDFLNIPPNEAQPPTRKWLHLLDGGLSDNLGMRSILDAYDRATGFIGQRINGGQIKRLVVIAVNARTDPPEQLSRQERAPGLGEVFMKTATVSMENLSFDTLDYGVKRVTERDQAQADIRVCNEKLTACGAAPLPGFAREIRTCFIEIDFDSLPSPDREWFLSLPTTFRLPEASLKKLINVARHLLNDSPDYQKLLRALRGEASLGAGVGETGNCS